MLNVRPLAASALAAVAVTHAHAQIQPVSRSSHLRSDYVWYSNGTYGGEHFNETYTTWVSDHHHLGYVDERVDVGPGRIAVSAEAWGSAMDYPMQRSGWSYETDYRGDFLFDLAARSTFTLDGTIRSGQGAASVSLLDLSRGLTLFTIHEQQFSTIPYSTSGPLPAGRYRLLVTAHGYPMGAMGPGEGLPSATLTIVQTPPCPADFNDDGFVDFFDYNAFVSCFETGACPPGRTADFNRDGFADFFDYADFVAAFETAC